MTIARAVPTNDPVSTAVSRAMVVGGAVGPPGGSLAMAHICGEVTIDAPVEEVFDLVADERNEPRYNPRIVRAEKLSEGPVGRGARFVAEPKGRAPRAG
jgi:hypothetical protein